MVLCNNQIVTAWKNQLTYRKLNEHLTIWCKQGLTKDITKSLCWEGFTVKVQEGSCDEW